MRPRELVSAGQKRGASLPPTYQKGRDHTEAVRVLVEAFHSPRPKVKADPEPVAVVSSELIPIQKAQLGESEVNAVSGRDLHAFLEVGKDFSAWMPEQIEAFGFQGGVDFGVFSESGENSKGGRPRKEYMISISISMAKATAPEAEPALNGPMDIDLVALEAEAAEAAGVPSALLLGYDHYDSGHPIPGGGSA